MNTGENMDENNINSLSLSEVDVLNIVNDVHKDKFVFTVFTPDETEWEVQVCTSLGDVLEKIEEIIGELEEPPQLCDNYLLWEDFSITITFVNSAKAKEVSDFIEAAFPQTTSPVEG